MSVSQTALAAQQESKPPKTAARTKPAAGASASGISRTAINFLLDSVLLVLFLLLAWTNVVLRFVFPRANDVSGWTLWGRSYDDWTAIQFNLFCAFGFAVLLHVMLHWSWICGVIGSRLSRWRGRTARIDDASQTIYGVAFLIGVLNVVGLAIAAAALMIRAPRL